MVPAATTRVPPEAFGTPSRPAVRTTARMSGGTAPTAAPQRRGGWQDRPTYIYIHLCVCIQYICIYIYIGRYMHVCLYNICIYIHSYSGLSLFSYGTRSTESVFRAHLQAYSVQGCVHILNSILYNLFRSHFGPSTARAHVSHSFCGRAMRLMKLGLASQHEAQAPRLVPARVPPWRQQQPRPPPRRLSPKIGRGECFSRPRLGI